MYHKASLITHSLFFIFLIIILIVFPRVIFSLPSGDYTECDLIPLIGTSSTELCCSNKTITYSIDGSAYALVNSSNAGASGNLTHTLKPASSLSIGGHTASVFLLDGCGDSIIATSTFTIIDATSRVSIMNPITLGYTNCALIHFMVLLQEQHAVQAKRVVIY